MGAHSYAAGSYRGLAGRKVGLLSRRRGFTLIELLVVIGIIAVLAAIVIPVYARAQERARQGVCISNMHSIIVAMKMYQQDYKGYPPEYDPVTGWGGVTALFAQDYLTNAQSLRCPDDQTELKDYMTLYASLDDLYDLGFTGPTISDPSNPNYGEAWDLAADGGRYYREHYSSYNCAPAVDPAAQTGAATADFLLFNAYGYDIEGLSHLSTADATEPSRTYPPASGRFAGLSNRWAPDETIVTHCPFHRDYFGGQARWQDIVVRVGGDAGLMGTANYDWINQPPK